MPKQLFGCQVQLTPQAHARAEMVTLAEARARQALALKGVTDVVADWDYRLHPGFTDDYGCTHEPYWAWDGSFTGEADA